MHQFLDSNPGLRSRFSREIEFSDYTDDELVAIIRNLAAEAEFVIADDADDALARIFRTTRHQPGFGNARFARNLFEQAINRQALRLERSGVMDLDRTTLLTLTRDDIEDAARLL
jgi:stage V sporulation protein K